MATKYIEINADVFIKASTPRCTGFITKERHIVTKEKHIVYEGDVFECEDNFIDCKADNSEKLHFITVKFLCIVIFKDFEIQCYRPDQKHYFPIGFIFDSKFLYNIFEK